MNLPALPEGNGSSDKHHDASNGIHGNPFSLASEPSPGEPNDNRNNTKSPQAPLNAESSQCSESSIAPATQPHPAALS
jgi:hypothetical protein